MLESTYKNLIKTTSKEARNDIKVYVGMSGGVDSSVTALKIKKMGFNVTGVFMQCWGRNNPKCKAHKDRADAIKVAGQLNIPIQVWDFEDEYKKKVIEYFFYEYKNGRTPNPDILCNSEIKFKLFVNKAIEKGADYIATGHYAKVLIDGTKYYLAAGEDKEKDQSYFLAKIDKKVLPKVLFPLGSVKKKTGKSTTRLIAAENNLVVANKPDSTGICFLEDVKAIDFLKSEIKEQQGNVLSMNNEIIGKHTGAWFYTIGQRHGFEITKYQGKPMYVISKNVKENTITVSNKMDLFTNEINVNEAITENYTNCYVRIRNLGKFYKIQSNSKNVIYTKYKIEAVAPGQFAVIYKKIGKEKIIVSTYTISD